MSKPRNETWESYQHLLTILRQRYEPPARGASQPRVVFILGAGASLRSDMPLWNCEKVKDAIIRAAQEGFGEFLKEACIRLETTLGTDCRLVDDEVRKQRLMEGASTEQLCAVACEIELSREKVLGALQELFRGPGKREAGLPPQLGYELVAHLLKHGFADHVITFNFDDLMSTAMRNELGSDDFELIASDHAICNENPDRDSPRVVQLHGSVRSEPTLRFTTDSTGLLSQRMKRILFETLFPDDRPVHLVSLGYSWNDPDLSNWLASLHERISSLTVVTRTEADLAAPLLGGKCAAHVLETSRITNSDVPLSIDQLLWALWRELRDSIRPAPPPAARHLILGCLFGPSIGIGDEVNGFMHDHTPELRFAAEVLLHVIKCQGMVTASGMSRDARIRRYRNVSPAVFKKTIEAVLKRGSYPEVLETLFARAETTHDFAQLFTDLHLRMGPVLQPVTNNKRKRIELKRREAFDSEAPSLLEEYVALIQSNPEVEIVRSRDPRTEWMFSKAAPLTGIVSLESRTRSVLKSPWTHLFVIAETGQWLKRTSLPENSPDKPATERHLLMINAALPDETDWERKSIIDSDLNDVFEDFHDDQGILIQRALMPWWQHNRHLTLAYSTKKGRSGEFLGAIFFQRPNKASRISPVYLKEAGDCHEVFLTFLTYLRRTLERQVFERALECSTSPRSQPPEAIASELDPGLVEATCQLARRIVSGKSKKHKDQKQRISRVLEVIEELAGCLATLIEKLELTPAKKPVRPRATKRPARRPTKR